MLLDDDPVHGSKAGYTQLAMELVEKMVGIVTASSNSYFDTVIALLPLHYCTKSVCY